MREGEREIKRELQRTLFDKKKNHIYNINVIVATLDKVSLFVSECVCVKCLIFHFTIAINSNNNFRYHTINLPHPN